MSEPVFSCIIPAKDENDPKLKELIKSIEEQDFPSDLVETIVVTEGDSESAKAKGIWRAKGKYVCMLCADNLFINKKVFTLVKTIFDNQSVIGIYSKHYAHIRQDNSLNRYFSLMGCNDPIPYYLDKCDRRPYTEVNDDELFTVLRFEDRMPSLGCNGTFWRREQLLETNLDHYYPMDVAEDLRKNGYSRYARVNIDYLWHRTSDNLFTFLKKRYIYARDLYCDRKDRRWKMLNGSRDYWKLSGFVFRTVTIIPTLYVSIRGFIKHKDVAWFWHPIVCIGFTITYGVLACRNLLKRQSLFSLSDDQSALKRA